MAEWKVKSWRLKKMFRCFRFSYKCLALKTSILHRCATVKSVSSSAARIEGAKPVWTSSFLLQNHCKVSNFPLFWGCNNRKHNLETWLSALHDEMQVLQRQGTSPKDWRLIEDLWGTKASRRWGLEGLLSVPCFFGDLVKDLKVSKPTTKMLALVFLWSCCILQCESLQALSEWSPFFEAWMRNGCCASAAEARHWALWVALMALIGMPWLHDSPIFEWTQVRCTQGLCLCGTSNAHHDQYFGLKGLCIGWLDGRNLQLVALVGFVGRKIQQQVDVVTSLCYCDLLPCFKDLN